MIDQADRRIREWIEKQGGVPAVTFDPPGKHQNAQGLSCYLLEIASAPQYRSGRRPPLVVTLRYLVTACSTDPAEAHNALGTVLFAAMQSTDFQVDLTPVSSETWLGLGVPPQPAFVLCVPFIVELPELELPLVREPLVVHVAPFLSLHGQVLGPGDVPISGAVVEVPGVNRQARTDTQGRFALSQLPGGSRDQQLIVHAKGKQNTITVENAATGEPVIIRFEGLDEGPPKHQ